MTSCDDRATSEWLQATPQLGDFFSPDRVQPTLRLDLDQRVFEDPNPAAGSRVYVNPSIGAEPCNADV